MADDPYRIAEDCATPPGKSFLSQRAVNINLVTYALRLAGCWSNPTGLYQGQMNVAIFAGEERIGPTLPAWLAGVPLNRHRATAALWQKPAPGSLRRMEDNV
jgi:hypothetical protein